MTQSLPYSSRCRTCGREIAAEAPECPHCGAANLEERCPHCNAVTTSSPDKELRYKCDLCGGPRVPRGDPKMKRGKRDVAHLKRANEARKARAKYRALVAAFGTMGFASTAFAGLLLLLLPPLYVLIPWAFFAGTSLITVLWGIGRAGAKTKEIQPAIDQAWMAAASDLALRMKGPFSAQKLAQTMGIDEATAEELLAQLEANDVVRSDVTEGGELAYQPRMRVAPIGGPGGTVPGAVDAEAEALAEAEAALADAERSKAAK